MVRVHMYLWCICNRLSYRRHNCQNLCSFPRTCACIHIYIKSIRLCVWSSRPWLGWLLAFIGYADSLGFGSASSNWILKSTKAHKLIRLKKTIKCATANLSFESSTRCGVLGSIYLRKIKIDRQNVLQAYGWAYVY